MQTLTNVQPATYQTGLAAFIAAGGLGSQLTRATVTFANTAGAVTAFTVTGDVIVRVLAVCKTPCASALGCNAELGVASDTDAILPTTDITLLAASEIWHDAAPDSDIETLATAAKEFTIVGGADIILTLSAQADSGAIAFYCLWTALSTDGAVA